MGCALPVLTPKDFPDLFCMFTKILQPVTKCFRAAFYTDFNITRKDQYSILHDTEIKVQNNLY